MREFDQWTKSVFLAGAILSRYKALSGTLREAADDMVDAMTGSPDLDERLGAAATLAELLFPGPALTMEDWVGEAHQVNEDSTFHNVVDQS